MSQYVVLQPVKHDGQPLEPGDSIELSEKAAQPMLDAGVIASPADTKAQTQADEDAEAQRLAAEKAQADADAAAAAKADADTKAADKRGGSKH